MLVYIPRFAYSYSKNESEKTITNIKFLNTDNTCKDGSMTQIYNEIETINENQYYVPEIFTQENIELEGIWLGKYLCKKDTDGINEKIYIASQQDNPQIWTGLTDSQKQEKTEQMTEPNNSYGLTNQTTVKIVDDRINNLIEKLKTSQYSFITDQIQENETDYTGSFRIYMY